MRHSSRTSRRRSQIEETSELRSDWQAEARPTKEVRAALGCTSRRLMPLVLCLVWVAGAYGQGNYEVQVYGSDLVSRGVTMVELHSNFTASGTKGVVDGVLPTNHAEHETLVITHIRPRVAVPESYKWPVGLSMSVEIGYQRAVFSPDTWTVELRPIVDKKIGKFYAAFNPTLDRSLHGPGTSQGFVFSPNVKFSYDVTKKVAFGLEYYGSCGPVTGFDPVRDQQQQILPAVDIDFGKNWEFNFGVGVGVTQATDHLLVKAILGYRFNNKKD